MTNFERIKAMSVEEMANFLDSEIEHCHFEDVEECPLPEPPKEQANED